MKRLAVTGLLFGLLTGCGWLGPGGSAPAVPGVAEPPALDDPPEMEEPPLASVNGVPGELGTFCWISGCADMFGPPEPAGVPAVSEPLAVAVPVPATEIHAYGIGPGGTSIEVTMTGDEVDPLPKGTVMLQVGVWFQQGGDAQYYWRVEALKQSGGASPSP